MDMDTWINEYLSLTAQIAGIVFSAGIAIYAFRYPILRDGAKILPETARSQYLRLRNTTKQLCICGAVTVFICILLKILVFILSNRDLLLLLLIALPLGALALTFICLRSLFAEM